MLLLLTSNFLLGFVFELLFERQIEICPKKQKGRKKSTSEGKEGKEKINKIKHYFYQRISH